MSVPPDPGDVRYNDLEVGSEGFEGTNCIQTVTSRCTLRWIHAKWPRPRWWVMVLCLQIMAELFGGSAGLCGKV